MAQAEKSLAHILQPPRFHIHPFSQQCSMSFLRKPSTSSILRSNPSSLDGAQETAKATLADAPVNILEHLIVHGDQNLRVEAVQNYVVPIFLQG